MEKVTMTIVIPKNLQQLFKIAAIKKGMTMTAILLETIKQVIKEDQNEKN